MSQCHENHAIALYVYQRTVYAITSTATSAPTTLQPAQLQIDRHRGTDKETRALTIPTDSDFATLASTEHSASIGKLKDHVT